MKSKCGIIFILVSISSTVVFGYVYKTTTPKTTTTIPVVSSTYSVEAPKCGQNQTLVYGCPPEPTCPDGNAILHTCVPPYPGRCICAEGYVLDAFHTWKCISVKDCRCANENEVFKLCNGCEPTCNGTVPNCRESCGFFTAGCQCKPGFVRNNGKCIDKGSCPSEQCTAPPTPTPTPTTTTTTATTTTTTTKNYGIRCYSGSEILSNCLLEKNVTGCLEAQKEGEKTNFAVTPCEPGVTQCYSLGYNCGLADGKYRVDKGCYNPNSTSPCTTLQFICRIGDANKWSKCALCEGDLCNKDYPEPDYPTTTTVITTTKSYH